MRPRRRRCSKIVVVASESSFGAAPTSFSVYVFFIILIIILSILLLCFGVVSSPASVPFVLYFTYHGSSADDAFLWEGVGPALIATLTLLTFTIFFFGGKSHADLALKQRSSQMQKLILQCGIYPLGDAERPTTACLEESELKTFQAVVRQNDRSAFLRKRGTTKKICDQIAQQFSKLLQGKIEVIRDAARGALQSSEHNDDDVVNDGGVVNPEGAQTRRPTGAGRDRQAHILPPYRSPMRAILCHR